MNSISKKVNNDTIEVMNKIYKELYTLQCKRSYILKENKYDDNIEKCIGELFKSLGAMYLSIIEKEFFKNTPNLNIVNLNNNSLTTIPSLAFANLPKLNTVDAKNNAIHTIETEAFTNLPSLTIITARSTPTLPISGTMGTNHTIATHAFYNLTSLETIDLSGRGFTHVEEEAFFDLPKLKELNMSHNNLQRVYTPVYLPNFATVDYRHNNITRIGRGAFNCTAYYPSLKQVYLTDNVDMMYVHEEVVVNCTELTAFKQGDYPETCPDDSIIQKIKTGNISSVDMPVRIRVCTCKAGVQCLGETIETW